MLTTLAASCARPATNDSATKDAATTESTTAALSSNVRQPVRVSPEGADAAEPAVATGPDGAAYVAWVEHRAKGEADLWLARVDDEGKAVGSPSRVNAEEGRATAWHGDPPTLAVACDGTLYVGWTARVEGVRHATTINVSTSRDGGRTFGPPVKVNDDAKPNGHGMHSLAVSTDGRVCVAWLDERNVAPPPPPPAGNQTGGKHAHAEPNRELFFASSTDGGRTFSANRSVAREVCPCCKTSLAVAADGRVYVGWRQVLAGEFRHVAVASTNDGGESFTEPVVVSDDRWMINACPVAGPALMAMKDGSLRVLWYTAGEAGAPGLYWSESRDGGRTFAPRSSFAESSGRGMPSMLPDEGGGFVAVWEGNGSEAKPIKASLSGKGSAADTMSLAIAGELPAAAKSGASSFVAYVSKVNQGRGVWLVSEKQN